MPHDTEPITTNRPRKCLNKACVKNNLYFHTAPMAKLRQTLKRDIWLRMFLNNVTACFTQKHELTRKLNGIVIVYLT